MIEKLPDTTIKEREIVTLLAKRLREKVRPDGGLWFQRVLTFKNPGTNRGLRERFREIFGLYSPPLQPEIDLILVEPDGSTRAVEVKYFRISKGRIDQSYYEGIEQGLALLKMGFDSSAVWQVFDSDVSNDDVSRYASRIWRFIRQELQLPLDYTVFTFSDHPINTQLVVMQSNWFVEGNPVYKLTDIGSPDFYITFKMPNPLLGLVEVQETRRLLLDWINSTK